MVDLFPIALTRSDLFIGALLTHLLADFFFQNEHEVKHKAELRTSLAGWTHGLKMFIAAWMFFPWYWSLVVGISHMLIDTRVPLQWWRRTFRQSTSPEGNPAFFAFALLQDQAAHIIILGLVAALV